MKKSERKALIREVVEEVQNNELNRMIQALEKNPDFVKAAMKKFGNNLDENRSSFMKKLAMMLLAAGISASAVSTAKAGPIGDLMRKADSVEQQSTADVLNKAEEMGMRTKNAVKGSTLDVVRKAKNNETFKRYKEAYIDAVDKADMNRVEQLKLQTIKAAIETLKFADDYNSQKNFIVGNIKGITGLPAAEIKQILEDHPEFLK